MRAIILILVVLTCCIIILFLILSNKSKPAPRNKRKNIRSNDLPAATPKRDSAPLAPSVPDNQRERIVQLKANVLGGIKSILSDYRMDDTKVPQPLQRSEIKPNIVTQVKNLVGDMKEFSSFDELSRLVDDPNVDMSKIAKKISTDPILSNKILKVANSAYFGSSTSVDSINHALALLGLINIKAIMFHNTFSKKLSGGKIQNHPIYQSLWGHAISTATCAFYLSEAFKGLNRGKLYTLGLVHDIGKFIIPEMHGSDRVDDIFMIPYGEKSSIIREDSALGINHAVIGRIAFEDSGLSEQLLTLVEYHHFPSFRTSTFYSSTDNDKNYIAALYLANQIAKLFAEEDEKLYFSIQPLPVSLGNLLDRLTLEKIFSDNRVLSEIMKTKSLTASYI